jgi:hypothetical protein
MSLSIDSPVLDAFIISETQTACLIHKFLLFHNTDAIVVAHRNILRLCRQQRFCVEIIFLTSHFLHFCGKIPEDVHILKYTFVFVLQVMFNPHSDITLQALIIVQNRNELDPLIGSGSFFPPSFEATLQRRRGWLDDVIFHLLLIFVLN